MAVRSGQPVQDVFFLYFQERDIPVTMFLETGIKLQGYV